MSVKKSLNIKLKLDSSKMKTKHSEEEYMNSKLPSGNIKLMPAEKYPFLTKILPMQVDKMNSLEEDSNKQWDNSKN